MNTKIYPETLARTIILIATILATTVVSQAQNTFLKTFGGIRSEDMHRMIRSHDGGFIMAGSTESYGQGNFGNTDAYIVKTDSGGTIIWSETMGLQVYDDIYWIEPTNDSAYVICGVASDNNTSIGILLAKISENGTILWQKVLEQDNAGIGYCIRQTTDGGFIVAAEILQAYNLDFLLIKTDANGNVQWSKEIGGADVDVPGYIMQTNDGGYLVFGNSRQNSATIPVYGVKTDSTGSVEWQKTYNTSPEFSRALVSNVIATADGGYVIAGGTTHLQLFSDIMLMKIDSGGDPQWVNAYGGTADEYCGSMIQNNDGDFIVCGTSSSSESDNFDALLMRIDSSGNLIQSALFGTTAADDGFVSILPLADGSYMLGGATSSFSQVLLSDFMMMRITQDFNGPQCDTLTPTIFQASVFLTATTDFSETDVNIQDNDVLAVIDSGANDSLLCDVATGEQLPPPHLSNELIIYSNPTINDLAFNGDYNGIARVEFYNMLGVKIYSVPFSTHLNIAELDEGYYFICFLNEEGKTLKGSTFVKK